MSLCYYSVFYLNLEVGIPEFKVNNFSWNTHWSRISDLEVRRTSQTLTLKSKMADLLINNSTTLTTQLESVLLISTAVSFVTLNSLTHSAANF